MRHPAPAEVAAELAGADAQVRRTALPNGLRVVTDAMPGAQSVSLGCWVTVGSRDEPPHLAGVSHFLEHLLFKGTDELGPRELAFAIDATGGKMNAYTSKEHTAYYARVPHRELPLALEVLGQVLTRPALRGDDVESEREVILEELLEAEDTPDDVVAEAAAAALFPEHPLGWDTLGDRQTLARMDRDDIAAFFHQWYRPANLVVAAAGRVDHDEIVAAAEAAFGGERGQRPQRRAPSPEIRPHVAVERPGEQVQLVLGWRAPDHHHPSRYALAVLNHAFGGGVSSRLFHEVRERRGLAYSVYSTFAQYADAGAFTVHVGTAPEHAAEVRSVVEAEVRRLLDDGLTAEELRVSKGYLAGSLALSLEDSGSRMARMATGEALRGEVVPLGQHLARIEAVGPDDVLAVAREVLGGPSVLAAVGPVAGTELAERAA